MDAGHTEPPVFSGNNRDHMADDPTTAADEALGFMPHYDHHIWPLRDNPNVVEVPFNPNVTCEHQG